MQLADANEVIKSQEANYEVLVGRVEDAEDQLDDERAARKSVEEQADTTQETLTKAIDFRRSKRASARGYLEQMTEPSDGTE